MIHFARQLHVQGKTDQAKADLSRLAKIRAEREAAAAKRKAEAEGQSSPKVLNPQSGLDFFCSPVERAKALEAAKAARPSKR